MNIKLLRSLQVFVEVANTNNMSTAAKNLHMTVSAISQQLRKLEQEMGMSLFNRNTRHISLTEAGQIYYQSSIELISVAERAHQRIEQLQETPSGKLKIIAPEGFGGGLLSNPIDELLSAFPKISVSLILTDEPYDVIASGADLAITLEALSDVNLNCQKLASWQLLLCAAGTHPLARILPDSPEALRAHCHIGHSELDTFALRHESHTHLLDYPRLQVNSMQALIQLTRDGLGFAVLPEPEIRQQLARGELVHILPHWRVPDYQVYAVSPKHDAVPVKTQAAVDCLKAAFSRI
ncbi:LysR family transcriptional regulator [Aestuariibacter sp. A3R04]|uniref:LysR family transcriptional regulator n=1 Tax=Aestuariibacter sp. A3R04 TaxID=2841571 RepID=UPI001C08B98B|nr:LysR family transcriptional regulator [Aestuariibacter sp. A3R04]MBU3020554.1 LysR family transcriptional regulator [Aestuariibacter sp. A3R04]